MFSLVDEVNISIDFLDLKEIIESTEGNDAESQILKDFFDVIGDNKKLGNEILNIAFGEDIDKDNNFHHCLINAMSNDSKLMDDMLDFFDDKINEDLLSNLDFDVNYLKEDDREIYFEHVIKEHGGKYSLKDIDDENNTINYNLDIFNVLKLFKKKGDFIDAIVNAYFDNFEYEEFIEELMLEKGYIDNSVDYENWDDFSDKLLTVEDLKDLLRKNNLKISGRKQELVDRVRENNVSLRHFKTIYYRFSDKGDEFLKENAWIEFYNIFLIPFEFADFYIYYQNHDEDILNTSFCYLDDCMKLAIKDNDDDLLKLSITTKKLIDRYSEELFFSK